ncbi:EcsC family protein [Anseongella ginsenosidimutans]|uniref:EcsC family protein n=1 Tax=Anseongella ginsenosidimutans TaxID=496056 RepID=A0A4R3KXU1_9SPHI|nr:EcsC family protein [Anseongella ginsenosidimutans]QEC51046.1 EcsC family protein [Anseongella ginsenosidimutans]TCS90298.1 EcsC family protein [Anseongella ginsenosidimutans]
MNTYEEQALRQLGKWQADMQAHPSFTSKVSGNIQGRINRAIPEKVHEVITTSIRQMTRAVFYGAGFANPKPLKNASLRVREHRVQGRIRFYRNAATAEGALTGAGGILLGLADFPLWLALKMKLLFEISALYGFDVSDYRERLYMLHIFQLTFSNQQQRNKVYATLADWEGYLQSLPQDINAFDWRSFQQDYRDYIDIAKLIQLIPGIGAVAGAYVNHRLTEKLGDYAMNAYRLRLIPKQ